MPLDPSSRCDELRLAVMRSFRHYSTDQLLPLLRNKSPIVRTATARELHFRGGFLVFQEASSLATSELAQDREIAAFLLGQLGTPHCPYSEESFPILEELMSDGDPDVMAAAFGAVGFLASLGKRASTRIVQRLIGSTSSDNSNERVCATASLGYFDGAAVEMTLSRLAEDPNRKIAKEAKFGLELIENRKHG